MARDIKSMGGGGGLGGGAMMTATLGGKRIRLGKNKSGAVGRQRLGMQMEAAVYASRQSLARRRRPW